MNQPSHKVSFDDRLLAVEELFRQRQHAAAIQEFDAVVETDIDFHPLQRGLYKLLTAERAFHQGTYRDAVKAALEAARILADSPENKRYGRVQFVLSKSYSALGDFKNAEIRAHNALAAYRRAGDAEGQINAHNELAYISFARSEYRQALGHLDEAAQLAADNPRKNAQLTGNAGMIRVLTGEWEKAERDLSIALDFSAREGVEPSEVANLLSRSWLHIRKREFVFATRDLQRAHEIISRLELKREQVIYLESAGELALERADYARAKTLLADAYQQGRLIAPDSTLVSQSARRLAEAELALDNIDEAMKYAQKALELAEQLGEKAEVGLARRVIARIFAVRREFADASENIRLAVEVMRSVEDPLELGRTMLALVDIETAAGSDDAKGIHRALEEAGSLFRQLKLDYWVAETEFKHGMFACQQGDLAGGFKALSRAERIFSKLSERGRVRKVHQFLQSLADQAVAVAISNQNEFKVFGNLLSSSEINDVKQGPVDQVLDVLARRTGAERVLVYTPDFQDSPIISSFTLSKPAEAKFIDVFTQLLGEEISRDKPTLLLDSRRDPYINDLFLDASDIIASVVVVPFRTSGNSLAYLYLDRPSRDRALNPFSQQDLNFAVGFTDMIAFKAAELQKMRLLADNRRLKAQLLEEAAFPNIITRSREMLEILSQVRQVVDASISITIEGETGSGKDLLARAIHYNSNRRDKRFISVNCAALPETLLESELFGYRRGAFTGADRDKAGLFEEADGGTFFLDEIADMPLNIQAKILRVLEEKELVRLGETQPRKVDVRILSATNKSLKEEIERGTFRQDLYYRLSALTFRLPPLRERKEDIPLLVQHFLGQTDKQVTSEVMKSLMDYDWPGNVRELDNEVKKLVLLAGDSPEISSDLLSAKIQRSVDSDSADVTDMSPADSPVEFSEDYSLYDFLADHERRFIVEALREHHGVKKHAAAMLKIPESTLRLKIKQYGIDLNHLDAIN